MSRFPETAGTLAYLVQSSQATSSASWQQEKGQERGKLQRHESWMA